MTQQAIWKFPIGVDPGRRIVEMPAEAKLLSVGLQDKSLVVWALVDPESQVRPRTIEIFYTGLPFDEASRHYVGSVQHEGSIGRLVWHVFERIELEEGYAT